MLRKVIFGIFLFTLTFNLTAQDYINSAGVKLGWGFGVTGKHFISEKSAIEAELMFQPKNFFSGAYYEYHLPAFEKDYDGFYWVLGGGIHFGQWKDVPWKYFEDDFYFAGITAVGGIEYVFKKSPFTLQGTIEPRMNIINDNSFWAVGGLTLRYIFKQKTEEETPE